MKRILTTGVSRLAIAFLLCYACFSNSRAQDTPELESKLAGIRPAANHPVQLYGCNADGSIDIGQLYTLNSAFYIEIMKDEVFHDSFGTGKFYTKVFLPGREHKKQQISINLGEIQSIKVRGMEVAVKQEVPTQKGVTSEVFNRNFWIETADLPSEYQADEYKKKDKADSEKPADAGKDAWTESRVYSRWTVGAMAVPFKYRFSYKSSNSLITGESTLGLGVGYCLARSRNFGNAFSLVSSFGLTNINPNTPFDADSSKLKSIPGASICAGFVASVQRAQIGVIYGYDLADPDWEFNRRPWIAFSIGFAFFTPKKEDKGGN